MSGPDFVRMSGDWTGTILAAVAALREGPRTIPHLTLALQHGTSRALPGDAIRAGGWDVLAKWAVEDLGTKKVPGLTPAPDGTYSLDDGPVWYTPGKGKARIEVGVGGDPAERTIDLPFILMRNPFDPVNGKWRKNLPDRTVTAERVDIIRASIRLRGWDEQIGKILIDEHDAIIEGHGRAEALEQEGIDWRNDRRYFVKKKYGDTPDGNRERILDAVARNTQEPLSAKTRTAIAQALATTGTPVPEIAALLDLTERRVRAITVNERHDLTERRKAYARHLAGEGLTQETIAAEVTRLYGVATKQRTIADWLSDEGLADSDMSSESAKPPEAETKPKALSPALATVVELASRPEGVTRAEATAATGLANPISDARRAVESSGQALIVNGERRDRNQVVHLGPIATAPPQRTTPAPSAAPSVSTETVCPMCDGKGTITCER